MNMLSTGMPSTLGNWYKLCSVVFGKDSSATKFIQARIEQSTNGTDEEVIAQEKQLLYALMNMHINDKGENKQHGN